jgi:integrase
LGEIMAMRWEDIDFRQRIITISRSLSDTKRARHGYNQQVRDA